ncbi:hypothetical protein [Acinetobacter bouvetii]|uniref:Uncharacterized protein n=1 Tax=Acinetobacter bouvetii TaxID=202951 RepID=A0A811GDR7_9GAMM|nr:hypothetical protein [Acinetobacter bouvetii]CAB1215693.1 hypothetical protein SFB21_1790 [Acinetobacter bouvetii]
MKWTQAINLSLSALFACLSFYSGLYLIDYFFYKHSQALILLLGIMLLVFTCLITPYSYERKQKGYDETMRFDKLLYYPPYHLVVVANFYLANQNI